MYWPAAHVFVVITDGVVLVHTVETYWVVPYTGVGHAAHVVPGEPGTYALPGLNPERYRPPPHICCDVITDGVVGPHTCDTYSTVVVGEGEGVGHAVHAPAEPSELYVP